MEFTCQSETGKLRSLFIKDPQAAFVSEAHLHKDWERLNYLSKPHLQEAIDEYKDFVRLLQETEPEIYYLPEDEKVNMDSIYCRDAAIATDRGMIICNMGKHARINEPEA